MQARQAKWRDEPQSLMAELEAILPTFLTHPCAEFHRTLLRTWLVPSRGTAIVNAVAPRGFAKSTWISGIIPALAALTDPKTYCVLVSATHELAIHHLTTIRKIADALAHAWGVPSVVRSRAEAIEFANGALVEAAGTHQQLRGRKREERRPTLLICDDIEPDECLFSPTTRARVSDWFFGAAFNTTAADARVYVASTPLHANSLAYTLRNTPGVTTHWLRAFDPGNTDRAFWATAVDKLRRERGAELLPTDVEFWAGFGKPAWPERWPMYALVRRLAAIGVNAFWREFMVDAADVGSEFFHPAALRDARCDAWPVTGDTVIAIDPALGGTGSDFTAIAIVRRVEAVFYAKLVLVRAPVEEWIERAVTVIADVEPNVTMLETNGFQCLLTERLARAYQTRTGRVLRLLSCRSMHAKWQRIAQLEPLLNARRLRILADEDGEATLTQLQAFPRGDHDDGPDAIKLALEGFVSLDQKFQNCSPIPDWIATQDGWNNGTRMLLTV